MSKVRVSCAVFLAGLVLFGIYYPYRFFSSVVPLDFSGDASWQKLYIVDDTALVPLSGRVLHFLLLLPIVVATMAMIVAAAYLVWRLFKGGYFEPSTARALQWVGVTAVISSIFAHIAIACEAWVFSRFNAENVLPIKFQFESGETGLLIAGLGVCLLGWVLRIAMIKKQENSEII